MRPAAYDMTDQENRVYQRCRTGYWQKYCESSGGSRGGFGGLYHCKASPQRRWLAKKMHGGRPNALHKWCRSAGPYRHDVIGLGKRSFWMVDSAVRVQRFWS